MPTAEPTPMTMRGSLYADGNGGYANGLKSSASPRAAVESMHRQAGGRPPARRSSRTAARGPDHRTYRYAGPRTHGLRRPSSSRLLAVVALWVLPVWARLLVLRPIQYENGGPAHACSADGPKCKFFQTLFLRIKFFFYKGTSRHKNGVTLAGGSTELVSEILHSLIL
jgi:hypothetical protein